MGQKVCDYCKRRVDDSTKNFGVISFSMIIGMGVNKKIHVSKFFSCLVCAKKVIVEQNKRYFSKSNPTPDFILGVELSKKFLNGYNFMYEFKLLKEESRKWNVK